MNLSLVYLRFINLIFDRLVRVDVREETSSSSNYNWIQTGYFKYR